MTRRQLLCILAFLEDEPYTSKRVDIEARVLEMLEELNEDSSEPPDRTH